MYRVSKLTKSLGPVSISQCNRRNISNKLLLLLLLLLLLGKQQHELLNST